VRIAGRDRLKINDFDQRFPAGSVLRNSYLAVREHPLRIHALTKYALYTLSADSSQQFSQLTTSVGLFGLQAQAIVPAHADVYVGHWAGLGRMGAQGYHPFLADRPQLRSITTLYGAPDQLWIGTEDRGLFCYQFSEDSLYAVSTVNYVRRIRPDTDSTLLVASNEGVHLVDTRQLQSRDQISVADGLPTEVIEDVCRYRDGRILIATSAGLHLAERQSRRPTHLAADALRFTSTHVNERPVDLSTSAAFAYRQNNFALHFHLQSYASQGNITYATRLEPLEKAWRVQSARYREFPALPPGNYRFHLKASDVYGNELSLPPLEWRIYPPFWQRWWFWGLVGLLVLGLLLWWLRRRDQRVREEQLLSKRMAGLQLAALKAQMNPHFVFNALGAIQYYIQTNDAEAADRYLTMFAGLMRRYLNSSREQIISLDEEIALLDTYTRLEMMRFEQQFTTTIRVDEALSRQDHYLPSMLLQPFVENAINHGLCERPDAAGELLIYFSGEGDTLRCMIADNGIGLEKARQRPSRGHRSSGMRIIDEKVQTLAASGQAEVTIERTEHQPENREFPGTRILITIKNLEHDDH
jgi:anti-sigma regulatory factor (Ser/Thr protein kinase)